MHECGLVKQNHVIVIDAKISSVAELATVRTGYPFRGPIAGAHSGGVQVAQMKDVDPSSGLQWGSVVRTELTGRKGPDWLQAGDILFVPRGQRFFAVCIGAPPGPAVCGPHLVMLRVRPEARVTPHFLAWQINQPPIQKQLRVAAEGTNQLSVRIAQIEGLRLAVPPIDRQLQIVRLVDEAARERRLMIQLIANREQQLAGIAADLAKAAGPDLI